MQAHEKVDSGFSLGVGVSAYVARVFACVGTGIRDNSATMVVSFSFLLHIFVSKKCTFYKKNFCVKLCNK